MKNLYLLFILLVSLMVNSVFATNDFVKLESVSCLIKFGDSAGSGTIFIVSNKVFVLTCAHVLDTNRKVREVIDNKGRLKYEVKFENVEVIRPIINDGRKVGKITAEAKIIRFSDVNDGEDIGLLEVLMDSFSTNSAIIYTDRKIPLVGTEVCCMASFWGEDGINSLACGIYSQIGVKINKKIYDIADLSVYPGASGSGLFINNEFCGITVRKQGDTRNASIPLRRVKEWAKRCKAEFLFDINKVNQMNEKIDIEDEEGRPTFKK